MLIIYMIMKDSDLCYDLWVNDPTFSQLFTVAETYATAEFYGVDCEQEADDAFVELYVYILQKKYGDNWQNYCNPFILAYYEKMMKRKQGQTGGQQGGGSSSGASPPPQQDRDTHPE
jgi:hypothetical protein